MNIKKSNKANLENKRGLFFQIGLILSLAAVLAAFEWKTAKTYEINDYSGQMIDIDEMIDITTQEEKEKVEIKPKVEPIAFKEVGNDIEDDDLDFTSEVDEDTYNDLNIEIPEDGNEETEEPVIFTVVEEMPSFPGGEKAMKEYLYNNLVFPKFANEAGISGTVYVSFVVSKDGSVKNAKVLRGIGGGCDEEALRVVNSMPDWLPGKQRSVPVQVQMVLPVVFKILN